MSDNRRKVVRYRKPININIGLVIFFIIFVYMVIQVVLYLNKEHISIYEVTEKTIADDNTYTGLILRDEKLVYTEHAGYTNFYVGEGDRIAKKAIVYTIDESGKIYDAFTTTESSQKLTKEDTQNIRDQIKMFQNNYDETRYNAVYDFKYDMENTILELTNVNMLSNLKQILAQTGNPNSFHMMKAGQSGIVSYSMDGFEDVKVEDIDETSFDLSKYSKTQLRITNPVEKNAPIYKIVSNENWSVVIPLTTEQYERTKDKERVKVTFLKDNLSTYAGISFFQKNEKNYAVLDMRQYMVRYIKDRYVEIELNLNTATGLKIPKTAILKKDFYKVPLEYFTLGGNSGKVGLSVETYNTKSKKTEIIFHDVEKIYEDEKYGYIDAGAFDPNTKIRMVDSDKTFELLETQEFEGVYNVNKGYCIFKRIEKVYENEEYCIVSKDTSYGLSDYDHIVLDASVISEHDIIY